MASLSARQLAYFQSRINRELDQTATVTRLGAPVRDSAGGIKQSGQYQPVVQPGGLTTVACSVGNLSSGEELMIAGKLTSVQAYALTLPVGTDIDEKDRVVVGSHTYEVKAVNSSPQNYQVQVRALVEEVK